MPKERQIQILILYDDLNWNNRHRFFYDLKCRRIYYAKCTSNNTLYKKGGGFGGYLSF